ncbi:tetratricopeptide repeat protein [Gigaspora margarita]|uniref:Tetratricopeptide repeat protein n=1 Tax=Gigaspora margarita TaxID=4874 RepID=A0A8H3XNT6_GIGMA|nr:tetratricopeptide repeat protein [Gigaspora margarita]
MMKDYDNALNDLNKLLEVDQDDETALKSREEIYQDFENLLKSDPTNPLYLGYHGAIHLKVGSLEKSQTDLRRAIELNPEEPYWHCQYGALLYKQNHDIESLHQLNIAIKSNPKYKFEYALKSEAHYFKGMVYKKMGHSEMANMDVEKAMGHFEMANMDFEMAIELDPNNELAIEEYKDKIQLITRYDH